MTTISLWLLFSSCSTDFDITAEQTETTIVWGILDAGESDHYIRIEKSFLQDGINAYELASDPENLYYQEEELTIYIERWKDSVYTGNYKVKRVDGDTMGLPKAEGPFAQTPNILYHFTANLDSSATYKLFVIKHATNDTLSAETKLVHAFKPLFPAATTILEEFADTSDFTYQCKYAVNGKIYELDLQFHYMETNTITGDSTEKSMNWQIFNNLTSDNITGSGNISYTIPRSSFYYFINNNIDYEENVKRRFLHLHYTFYAGGMSLYYLYLNNLASAGLSQFYATNNYTNIKNGFGIFSSRYSVEINNVLLTTHSLDTLACGALTGHLKFLPSILHPYYPACN